MIEIKQGTKSFYVGDSEKNPLAKITYVILAVLSHFS